jgi:hypothetical protein
MGSRSNTTRQGALGWTVVTCLIAALVGLIGFTVGASERDEAEANAAAVAPMPTPDLIPLSSAYLSGRREGYRRGRLGAYREGRLDGLEEGRRAERRLLRREAERIRRSAAADALDGLDPGGWFLVSAAPGGAGLGERVRLEDGLRYELCQGGSAVCSTTPTDR